MKANEVNADFLPYDEAFEDRKLFVHNLGELLSQTREGIVGCELTDQEIVIVRYLSGTVIPVNVNMDSYAAIICDVVEHTKLGV